MSIINSGKLPVVIDRIKIEFIDKKSKRLVETRQYDENAGWKPSVKTVPVERKPNTKTNEPNVLQPGYELREYFKPISEYNAERHLILVSTYIREKNRAYKCEA